MILVVVVVSERKRGARAPDIARILSHERDKLVVSTGSCVVQCARQRRKFALRSFVLRSCRRYFRCGSIRRATSETGFRGLVGFFLFVRGLRGQVQRRRCQKRERHSNG